MFTSPTPDQIAPALAGGRRRAPACWRSSRTTRATCSTSRPPPSSPRPTASTVRTVVVNDDVAVEDSLYTAGRRGVAGTVAVEKIAGAAAERGDDLRRGRGRRRAGHRERPVHGRRARPRAPSRTPASPSFDLPDDEIEIGIGIHGEPGRRRIPLAPRRRDHRDAARRPSRDDLGARRRREGAAVRQRHGRHARCPSSTSSIVGHARCSRSAGSR